jgi:hypothetical protein
LQPESVVVEREVAQVEGRRELAVIALPIDDCAVGGDIHLLGESLPDTSLVDDLDPWVPDAAERKTSHPLGRRRQSLVPPLQHHEDIGGEALVGAVNLRHVEQKKGALDGQQLIIRARPCPRELLRAGEGHANQ